MSAAIVRASKNTLAIVIASVTLAFFILIVGLVPHLALLSAVHFNLALIPSLIISTYEMLGVPEFFMMLATTLLFFVNVLLLVFYIQKKKQVGSVGFASAGISGIIASFFGIGCASCGTVIGTSFLGIVGASGLATWLPFGGAEFSVVGVIILAFSIYYLAKRINDPNVCAV